MVEKIETAQADEFKTKPEIFVDKPREFSDLDKGWSWMVMLACFAHSCVIGAHMNGVGIIHTALIRRYQESVSMTSWAGTLQIGVCSLGGPLSSAVADRFSCRTAIVASGLCFVVGNLGTAFAPKMGVAIFTCGILSGLGGALGYTANIAAIGLNFKQRRNIAIGFVLSGQGAGIFIFAPLMQFALEFYGPVGFFIILAAISANTVTFGAMTFPSELELFTQKARKLNAEVDKLKGTTNNLLKSYSKALFIKPVICLCISMLLYGNGLYVVILYLITFVKQTGFSATQASAFLSLTGVSSVIGRFLTGFVANFRCVNEIWLYSGPMFIFSLSVVVYIFTSDTYVGQITFFVFLGFFSGCCFTMMASIGIRFVGINFVSAVIAVQMFFSGIGTLVGPVCSGVLIDNGGTYKQCFVFAAISIFVAAISSALTTAFSTDSEKDGHTLQQTNYELSELLDVAEK